MSEQFKSWDELSRKEQLASIHYDYYKDVHGIRPRWMNYDAMSEADLEAELDQLGREAEVQAREEAEQQAHAIERLEVRIADLIATGAGNRDTAIRWIHQAEDSNGDDEYLCFLMGVPYGYFRKAA